MPQMRGQPHIELDGFYLDNHPSTPLPSSPRSDPVERHGQQFREMVTQQRERLKQQELLGKVFSSWQLRRADSSGPVSADVITNLKRTSRLLHYCSSPLLLLSHLNTADSSGDVGEGYTKLQERFLDMYIEYLKTLHFHPIEERERQPSTHPLSHSLYKCLQRSFSGGIMLIELSFQTSLFHVKLFSLESSRLSNVPPFSNEVSVLFSQECGRMKDYIHVHSFTYNFHLVVMTDILQGCGHQWVGDSTVNVRALLWDFSAHYMTPPHYIRHRLCTGRVSIPVVVSPEVLYRHILLHCTEFGLHTLELEQHSSEGAEEEEEQRAVNRLSQRTLV